jgi:hypothetical protein
MQSKNALPVVTSLWPWGVARFDEFLQFFDALLSGLFVSLSSLLESLNIHESVTQTGSKILHLSLKLQNGRRFYLILSGVTASVDRNG